MVVQAYAVCIGVTPECRQTESEMIGDGRGHADEAYHDIHHFQLDDSKPLESQINQMSDMRSQLATMGDEISDAKLAIIISGALPSLYDTLKTVAIASVTDMSQLMSDTLILQILREEKRKGNQDSTAALLAKQQKTPDKSSSSKQSQKSKKGKNRPCCTNLKCKKIRHTVGGCWAKGGGSEGKGPVVMTGSPVVQMGLPSGRLGLSI